MFELGLLPAEVLATQGVGVLSCSLGVSANTRFARFVSRAETHFLRINDCMLS